MGFSDSSDNSQLQGGDPDFSVSLSFERRGPNDLPSFDIEGPADGEGPRELEGPSGGGEAGDGDGNLRQIDSGEYGFDDPNVPGDMADRVGEGVSAGTDLRGVIYYKL